jgi:translocation and assembly module TamB
MTATDGASGTVNARGELDLAGEAFPFEMDVDITSARLVRRDDVTGNVGGTLRVAGNLREVAVTGDLVAGPAVVRVPEKLPPPTLPQTEVIEVNVPGAPAAVREGAAPPVRIALDVRCRVPRRVIVRAPILDTEWEGNLHVIGTADRPRIDGLLRIHKGYLDFLGRRFALDGSTLSFDGSADLMPYVNLEGRADTRDLTGILRVTGKPDRLRFSLDSEPVYPEDEVLARLLFGRRLDELSPVQAVQLARAATMLAGSVGGLRFLAGEMGTPGLGGFDVRAGDAPGEAVVGVGTYITDKIYAEIEQSTGSRATQTRVNIQLTPQFSVEAETGTGKTQGGGLFWKRDF